MKTRRRRSKDRLSITETVSINQRSGKAAIAEWLERAERHDSGFGGLEWKLSQVETIWQPHAAAFDVDGAAPAEHSLAWYAEQILTWLARARAAYASQSLQQVALVH